MAEHLLLPKRLARSFPRLGKAAQVLESGFLRALTRLLQALPVAWSFALSRGCMRALAPLTPMWDKVRRNHAIAFPELDARARNALRRQTFAHLGDAIAELVLAPSLYRAGDGRIDWQMDPALEETIRERRPMVMVTGHVGAWQLTNMVARRWEIPLTSLYSEESNAGLAALMLELRNGLGCRWLPSAGGIRTLLEELRAGHSVGLACDTRMDQGESVAFFGHEVLSNTVPARLSLRTGAPLVPVLAERLPGHRYRISLQAPVAAPANVATPAAQALEMTAAMMARFEGWVRARPAEWMCLSRRFAKDLDKAARHD